MIGRLQHHKFCGSRTDLNTALHKFKVMWIYVFSATLNAVLKRLRAFLMRTQTSFDAFVHMHARAMMMSGRVICVRLNVHKFLP